MKLFLQWGGCTSLLILMASLAGAQLSGQEVAPEPEAGSALAVVHDLYDLVTFPAGTIPDWDRLRAMFLPDAVVALRAAPDSLSIFSVEGFVQDWVRFIDGYNVVETGFQERITRTQATEYGDIAHVWVLYEAEIPGRGRPPTRGVDSFQLLRRAGEWKIASVTNEIVRPNQPLPAPLRGGG